MESDLFTTGGICNGINLANYFPTHRSFNSVVYTHKRFLKDAKEFENQGTVKSNLKIIKPKCKKKNKEKHDKTQQFDGITTNEQIHQQKRLNNTKSKNNSILNQTIRFAKNLVPLAIPPEDASAPVFYTIGTKTCKSKDKKTCTDDIEQNLTYNKPITEMRTECYRKENNIHHDESSIKDSISQSPQNTIDEINESLSCTISNLSEKKYHKRINHNSKYYNSDNEKIVISQSFEALAAETVDTNDGSKIKIHLMNDREKNFFSKSLQMPIIKAIKECISNHYDSIINSELKIVHRQIKCNSEKLDVIMDKVAGIENKLDNAKESIKTIKYPKTHSVKASKLEQLSEDLIEIKRNNSTEEESRDESEIEIRNFRDKRAVIALDYNEKKRKDDIRKHVLARGEDIPEPLRISSVRHNSTEEESRDGSEIETRKFRDKRVVIADYNEKRKDDKRKDVLARGEHIPEPLRTSSVSHLGEKLDRPNRIPARFCWTEAASNE